MFDRQEYQRLTEEEQVAANMLGVHAEVCIQLGEVTKELKHWTKQYNDARQAAFQYLLETK
jgi:hypothetical protein